MRKALSILLVLTFCLVAATGCESAGQGGPEPVDISGSVQASPTVTGEPQDSTDDPTVIAESSNIVSDKEKQEILDALADQIDDSLGSLDELDELDDSDLNMDDIE